MQKLVGVIILTIIFTVESAVFAKTQPWQDLNNQTIKLYLQGDYALATKTAKQALKIAEDTFEPNDLNLAKSLNNMALLYKTQGRYDLASFCPRRRVLPWSLVPCFVAHFITARFFRWV